MRLYFSEKKQEYYRDNNLCFNYNYPDHVKFNYKYLFNPDQVLLKKNNNKTKIQLFRTYSYRPARVHALRAHSSISSNYNIYITNKSSDSKQFSK